MALIRMVIAPTDQQACSNIRVHPRTRPHYRRAYLQAIDLQDALVKCLNDPDASYADKAKCSLAWERLEERKRILRNRPLPGSLKPEAKSKRTKPTSVEPIG